METVFKQCLNHILFSQIRSRSGTNVKDRATGDIPKELFGKAFAQKQRVFMDGVGSLHFPSTEPPYVSFTNIQERLDDNTPMAEKMILRTIEYEAARRRYKAEISWHPRQYKTSSSWEFTLIFSVDFTKIVSGLIIQYAEADQTVKHIPKDINYTLIGSHGECC